MKKAVTILKEIDRLEVELFSNYTDKEIWEAIKNLEYKGSNCIPIIAEGLDSESEK